MRVRGVLLSLALVSLLGTAITLPASQGRIIRLSYVDGDVQVHLSTASAPQQRF
jgi:hypothetical protein